MESKGGGMHPTPHMNLLLGPSATEVPDKEDNSTTKKDLDYTMTCLQENIVRYESNVGKIEIPSPQPTPDAGPKMGQA